ncbi:hypothetical protein [endosymbiont GvMRE of Glomus versiforme]|uniref:hypothetical protein n=1 Tax=endosymbiont GvMRE of Glomus versiforme TaxID=2039283 RepID=UPI000ED695B0|nr:hypothetical protein [endosymbiont GvMRE of Glomus versiforme]RHZ36064.1 hypothetical protein GvMRE_Ic3g148 [endosymbiont GvMRE of Glomus versiforme]
MNEINKNLSGKRIEMSPEFSVCNQCESKLSEGDMLHEVVIYNNTTNYGWTELICGDCALEYDVE